MWMKMDYADFEQEHGEEIEGAFLDALGFKSYGACPVENIDALIEVHRTIYDEIFYELATDYHVVD